MKVLVYRDTKKPFQIYEERYYHNLKYFIEKINNDQLVSDIDNYFDIAHFIGLDSKEKILKLKKEKENIPVIITYISNKSRQKEDDPTDIKIPNEEVKVLNVADKVIALTEADFKLLQNNGVESPIEIIGPGVREAKFSNMNDLEIDAFNQYAGLVVEDKIALGFIDYRSTNDIVEINKIANEFKEMKFFVFAKKMNKFFIPHKNWKMIKNCPKNVKYKNFIDEDLYKSALLRADFFISPSKADNASIPVYDAMITKTPIFSFYSPLVGTLILDKKNAYVSYESEQMISQIKDMYSGNLKLLVDEAYKFVEDESYENIACLIKNLYNSLVK